MFAETAIKETKEIKIGNIKGQKLDSQTWKISVNIDTEIKVGGFQEKQKSRKISFEKVIKTVPNSAYQ